MKITDIRTKPALPYEPKEVSPKDLKSQETKSNTDTVEISNQNINWQKNILLDALDKLEKNIQPANSGHPLDRPENQPIESLQEALIDLKFFDTPLFKEQALGAQANLKPEDVLDLFTQETAA